LDFVVSRYNADGSLDSSFGTGGTVTTDFFHQYDIAYAVAIQPDGKIVVGGSTFYFDDTVREGFVTARYNTDGSLDMSFGTGGKVVTIIKEQIIYGSIGHAICIQKDGKIIVGGGLNIYRYNADGSLDKSFGSRGQVVIKTDTPTSYSKDIFSLNLQ